jgi:hypothetical protein
LLLIDRAPSRDRDMADGTASVGKVHRNSKGPPKSLQLGEHTFNLVDGAKQQHPVLVVDGEARNHHRDR